MALTEMERAAIKAHQELQDKDELSYYTLFKAGAEWQKNHVWHKPDEPIENDAEVLIEYETGFHDAACYNKDEDVFYTGACCPKRKDIIRWAYIKDLY